MKKALLGKLNESLQSVLPVVAIIFLINLTPLVNLSWKEVLVFGISSLFLILGISLFNLGSDLAMSPMGEFVGTGLTRTRNKTILLGVCFLMGTFVTVAEPDLAVLAGQVSALIQPDTLIATIGIGVGLFLMFAILRIIYKVELSRMMMLFYMLAFAICAMLFEQGKGGLLPMAFDSGGVTTGPITVPFIMALGLGIATTISGKDVKENSFGLIALCSIGPVLAVLVISLLSSGQMQYSLPDYSMEGILKSGVPFLLGEKALEVLKALGMIVIFFFLLQILVLKLPKRVLMRIVVGLLYTFFGLVIFLTAVTVGFMPVGFTIGSQLSGYTPVVMVVFAFVIGCVTVLAEPAVHGLNRQVEEVTEGSVSRTAMMTAMAVGVGLSIALSVLRIILDFSVLYYLVPGYFISFTLSMFVPKLYTAIAFDSGGVASGPLTSSFILPMITGICAGLAGESKVMELAFGMVAMVAMAPLITIQFLGFRAIAARKLREEHVLRRIRQANDDQIIYFDI